MVEMQTCIATWMIGVVCIQIGHQLWRVANALEKRNKS